MALAESYVHHLPCCAVLTLTQPMMAMAPSQAVINTCASGDTPVRAGGTAAMATDMWPLE
jgi:hypothetical protein